MLNELNAMYRQIFTDGPRAAGRSAAVVERLLVGKWDGDTLVVQTIGFRDDLWLD